MSFCLLSELYSLLFIMYIMIENNISFRLLSELYSLLFYLIYHDTSSMNTWVSVSSRSYILSYKWTFKVDKFIAASLFPPPLGVIFSLIQQLVLLGIVIVHVSVSSRSYILSYKKNYNETIKKVRFPSPLGVIFSLINASFDEVSDKALCFSFRLLSELYSLLYNSSNVYIHYIENSFRLLSELYSLLYM